MALIGAVGIVSNLMTMTAFAQRMARRFGSLQSRMTLLLLGFVTIVLASTLIAVFLATAANVREQAEEDLRVGARVFQELLANRNQQLAATTQVLADDFAFREAVATEDAPTIRSALGNHGARINADVMLLSDNDGELLATAWPAGEESDVLDALSRLFDDPEWDPGVVSLGGSAYQLVTATVRAPLPVARVAMGFRLDDALAEDMRSLTNLQVSFINPGADFRLYSSTLNEMQRTQLPAHAQQIQAGKAQVETLDLNNEEYLSLLLPLNSAGPGPSVLLQTSLREALAPFNPLWIQLVTITLLAFLLSLLLAGGLARHVTRPVRALARSAERIRQGDYGEAVSVPLVGELAQLGHAFNAMQVAIQEREERILHQAYHDPLTGLPNRALAADRLSQAIAQIERSGGNFAVIVLDINRFKEINDSLGHPTGDRVLQVVAERLKGRLRRSDTVARLGGDEFLVLVHSEHLTDLERIAKELIETITNDEMIVGDARLKLSISMGIATCPKDGDRPEQLMRRADIAMYEAKQDEADYRIYQAGRDEAHLRRLQMVADLRDAVDHGQFQLHYQPKITVPNRKATHLEALLRWEHPERGRVSPEEFIPLAEHAGYIRDISRWVLAEVIRQLVLWRGEGLDIGVAVNISALDLMDSSLPGYVKQLLDEANLDPSALGLEITETTVMRDARYAVKLLEELKALGISIAIDDFGTGYSSLAQLRSLPVDELKIDKSFVMKLAGQPEGEGDPLIVRSTIELAHNMGLRVVAEGVEDAATWWRLSGWGCDSIQGFWIAKPMAPQAFPKWLEDFANRDWHDPKAE